MAPIALLHALFREAPPWLLLFDRPTVWILLTTLVLALLFRSTTLASWFPRMAAASWPYAPLAASFLFLIVNVLPRLLSRGMSEWVRGVWLATAGRYPIFAKFEWFWPWFPLLLVGFVFLYAAARWLVRPMFQFVFFASLALSLGAVVLQVPVAPPSALLPGPPPPQVLSPAPPAWPLKGDFQPALLFQPRSPYASLGLPLPGGSAVAPQYVAAEAPRPHPASTTLGERVGRRVLSPTLHDPGAMPDTVSLLILGGLLVLLYHWLSRVNAFRDLPQVVISRVHQAVPLEADAASGEKEGAEPSPAASPGGAGSIEGLGHRLPYLERILEETLQRSAPHTPARFPGGSPIYWRQLANTLSQGPGTWKERLAAFLMHSVTDPGGLQVNGVVRDMSHAPEDSSWVWRPTEKRRRRPRAKVAIELVELRTHRTLLAQTFTGDTVEDATVKAGYAIAERVLVLRPWVPEWVLWREDDGSALQHYWRGVETLRGMGSKLKQEQRQSYPELEAAIREGLKPAAESFKQAAYISHGNALARLQLAEVMEGLGRESFVEAFKIYLELTERYPSLVISTYRLATICGVIHRWSEELLKPDAQGQPTAWYQVYTALSRSGFLRKHLHEDGKPSVARENPSRDAVEAYFLKVEAACLQHLRRFSNGRILWSCLSSVGDRRRFWRTSLWPPKKLRALQRLVRTALLCNALRTWQRKLLNGDTSTEYVLVKLQELRKLAGALGKESRRMMMVGRSYAWGQVHYNLTCFYSLAAEALGKARQKAPGLKTPETWQQERLDCIEAAIDHLSFAMRDPKGPLASGGIWWMFLDPDLDYLKKDEEGRRAFDGWRQSTLTPGMA